MGDLTKNFSYKEFYRSEIADINNFQEQYFPDDCIVEQLEYLVKSTLQPARSLLPRNSKMLISSGYRCERVEKILTWHQGFKNWCQKNNRAWEKDYSTAPNVVESWKEYFKRKQHPKGQAADVKCFINGKIKNLELVKIILDFKIPFDQMIREDTDDYGEPDWIHISAVEGNNRMQHFFTNPNFSL